MKIRYSLKIQNPTVAKLHSIILVRLVTGMGLKEAKIMVEDGDVEVIGERTEHSLRPDTEDLKLLADSLARTREILEAKGVVFTLSLSVSVEVPS